MIVALVLALIVVALLVGFTVGVRTCLSMSDEVWERLRGRPGATDMATPPGVGSPDRWTDPQAYLQEYLLD